MSTSSTIPAFHKAETLSNASNLVSNTYDDPASFVKTVSPFHEEQQQQRLCSYRLRFCTDQTPCAFCQELDRIFVKSASTTATTTKPWRVAFLPEHHHPYQHQQDVLRFSKPATQITQNVPRRLSSGSACETCRRRKTKCDGGQPCAYCSINNVPCTHRPTRKRSQHHLCNNNKQADMLMGLTVLHQQSPHNHHHHHHQQASKTIMKQASCPSLKIVRRSIKSVSPPATPPPSEKCAISLIDSNFSTEKMPSITDQLSCRTFSAVTVTDVKRTLKYPIYPLLLPTPPSSVDHTDI